MRIAKTARRKTYPAGHIGRWSADAAGLPAFEFAAPLPLKTPGADPHGPHEPEDPWFLIGNFGLTVFAHASGGYQLMSCERGFARLNHDGGPGAVGWACHAVITRDGCATPLIGMDSEHARTARKRFGCGFARYDYDLGDGLRCVRTLATVPSRDYRDRVSAMRVTIEIKNSSDRMVDLGYEEGLDARYHLANWANRPNEPRPARYAALGRRTGRRVFGHILAAEEQPLVFAARRRRAKADGHPAHVVMEVLDREGKAGFEPVDACCARLSARWQARLAPGERRVWSAAIGYRLPEAPWPRSLSRLAEGAPDFRAQWAARIPAFKDADAQLALEMRWHAYCLHAMATWDEFYGETFIPQGTVYEYALGVAACARDHLQHCLPLPHYDPDLARSILRFAAKHTDVYGRIRHADEGLGFAWRGHDEKSDSQIYALAALAEYLRVTRDPSLLLEQIPFDGMVGRGSLLERAELWFRYLRDGVGVGARGLVRNMNADWNDECLSYFTNLRYPVIFNGESLLNTTMAIDALGELARALKRVRRAPALGPRNGKPRGVGGSIVAPLLQAAEQYRSQLLDTFLKDWEGRSFVARWHVAGQTVGADEMYLEPQPYALAMDEIALDRRRALWDEMRRRLCPGEKKGARQRERPGSREHGGFWFSLNGPLAIRLGDVDAGAADAALQKMTLRQHAHDFPDHWIGMWSAGDSFDSGRAPGGASRVNRYLFAFPIFCAHAHAWPLYVWLRLRERLTRRRAAKTH